MASKAYIRDQGNKEHTVTMKLVAAHPGKAIFEIVTNSDMGPLRQEILGDRMRYSLIPGQSLTVVIEEDNA